MGHLWRAGQLLQYLWRGNTRHGIHSPFVYRLIDEVIYQRAPRPDYARIDQLKNQLLSDSRTVQITDLGAGSTINQNKQRTVKDLTASSAKQPRYGQLLYRLAQHFKPNNMVELGTSMGISAMYQALGHQQGKLYTIEGCPNTAAIAHENLGKLGLANAEVVVGGFDDVLPELLQRIGTIDWAFVDGNHRSEPTLRYFELFLQHASPGTILIFDDIHWSDDMLMAWEQIKAHPRVTLTIDLFQVGVVSLRSGQAKEHFTIIY